MNELANEANKKELIVPVCENTLLQSERQQHISILELKRCVDWQKKTQEDFLFFVEINF